MSKFLSFWWAKHQSERRLCSIIYSLSNSTKCLSSASPRKPQTLLASTNIGWRKVIITHWLKKTEIFWSTKKKMCTISLIDFIKSKKRTKRQCFKTLNLLSQRKRKRKVTRNSRFMKLKCQGRITTSFSTKTIISSWLTLQALKSAIVTKCWHSTFRSVM